MDKVERILFFILVLAMCVVLPIVGFCCEAKKSIDRHDEEVRDAISESAYNDGYDDGYSDGCDTGYDHGYYDSEQGYSYGYSYDE